VLACGCGSAGSNGELDLARQALRKGNLKQAKARALSVARDSAAWAQAQLLLGEIEAAQKHPQAALEYFAAISRDGSAVSVDAVVASANQHYERGALASAAECLEYVVEHRPEDARARLRLAQIYFSTGQPLRAEPHFMAAMKKGWINVEDMVKFSVPERGQKVGQFLERCAQQNPREPFANLGLAYGEIAGQNRPSALDRLRQVVETDAKLGDAQALLGELLLDGSESELQSWHRRLPQEVQNHPGIWFVRGMWARRRQQNQAAARCFWEAAREFPLHRRAVYQLSQVLGPLDSAKAQAFSRRAQQLRDHAQALEQMLIHWGKDQAEIQRMTNLLVEMGRQWEAWAWINTMRQLQGPADWSDRLHAALTQSLRSDPPRFRHDKDPARQYSLAHYPVFPGRDSPVIAEQTPGIPEDSRARVSFADQSAALGVDFTYHQGHNPNTRGVRVFETNGGGVGVLDYDHDGWPDLFLTQGKDWPLGKKEPVASAHHNRLYRNAGGSFLDVTRASGLDRDEGYGQGCCCGDFDNDGFTDIYVANIGRNRLLRNNGDGTFSDVTQEAAIRAKAWTTSCLILDLNADGHPDLFDVNYLEGDNVFLEECQADRCSVSNFRGAANLVQLSRGDGSFVAVPDGLPPSQGKGLGIIALYFEGETRPTLFVADDQVPNVLLRPSAKDGCYEDEALMRGLAFNRDGQTTACMGVAAGDLNHDRRVDLFVTNFTGESKVLYLHREGGFFEDAVLGSGLMMAGMPYVGWGTQCLDADNDGDLDLVATNGHIADFGEAGVEYRMPTQFFRNLGQGRFVQQSPETLGPLFGQKGFGRALATVDWNRDGRTDFVLGRIDDPTAIATNTTAGSGHWLDVRLRARRSARDSVGSMVTVYQPGAVHFQQLIAGDGFQASNERQLHFGLGNQEVIERIEIRWPSGSVTSLASVPCDGTLEVVEDMPAASLWRATTLKSWPARLNAK
jgi:tetratricopeptide (TPR) repeat protein